MWTNGYRRTALWLFIFILLPLFGGCAQKASLIKAGAAQYEAESLAAIDKIEEIHVKELQDTPVSEQEKTEKFIDFVNKSSGSISLAKLDVMLGNAALDLRGSEKQWRAFLQELRSQYTLLSATFSGLDKGSFFARDSVQKTVPYIEKLTASMAAFAQIIKNNPPVFVRRRNQIAAELETVRDDPGLSDDVKRLRYRELHSRLTALANEESQLEKEATGQCLKAARLGLSLKKLAEQYNQLSLNDISEGLATAFRLAGNLTGRDLSSLQANTDDIVSEVRNDEALSALFNAGLREINQSRSNQP